jgi:hypothetical protein
MTTEEFDKIPFNKGTTVTYKNRRRVIMAVNFEEHLLGLNVAEDDEVEYDWVRCENTSDYKLGKNHSDNQDVF